MQSQATIDIELAALRAAFGNNRLRMPRPIGVAGVTGSGKTTVTRILVKRYGLDHLRVAGPLKSMTLALMRDVGMSARIAHEHVSGNLKEEPIPQLCGISSREIQQMLGTEWGRKSLRPQELDFWEQIARGRILLSFTEGRRVVFDDVRFANEAKMIHNLGGEVWMMSGRLVYGVPDHPSEQMDFPFNRMIDNSGSMESLEAQVIEAIEE